MAGLKSRPVAAREQWGLMLRLHFLLLKRQATASPGRKFVMAVLVILGAVASALLGFTAFAGMVVGRMRMMRFCWSVSRWSKSGGIGSR